MGLDVLLNFDVLLDLDNSDKSSKQIVMHDKEMHQITSNHIKCYKVKVTPFMFYYCLRDPNLSQFCSKTIWFHVNGNFETIAPGDSKMILNDTRQNIPIICFTSLPEC